MHPYRLEVRITPQLYADALALHVIERRDGKVYIAQPLGPLIFSQIPEIAPMPEPTLLLGGLHGKAFLKALVDGAQAFGIKPESHSFLEGELAAAKRHLEDMRALVFKGRRP